MTSKILINAIEHDECRIAKVKDNKLEEIHFETAIKEITQGNIYKAVITRIEPSLQAVFVDYGGHRHGFLQKQEIHQDYFQSTSDKKQSLNDLLQNGQELIVQVSKDPIMKKGAMLTTFISLPGRYLVLLPGSKNRGVSRQISDENERTRLKTLINKLKIADGYGFIVRTAGEDATKTQMGKDIKYLMNVWTEINKKAHNETGPHLLYKERNLAVRTIRDYFNTDVSEILVDDIDVYREVKAFVNAISPERVANVKLHKGVKPIFTKYQLEDQIASIFESRVSLKSGGSIVMEQTSSPKEGEKLLYSLRLSSLNDLPFSIA